MKRLSVLVISDLFPNPVRTTLGSFVERQVSCLQEYCDQTLIVPIRLFPPSELAQAMPSPIRMWNEIHCWRQNLKQIPDRLTWNNIEVHYPRYWSPPRKGFRGNWGAAAYLAMHGLIEELHLRYQFDLIHAHVASPAGVMALKARACMKVPVVVSIHGADIHYTLKQNVISANAVRRVFREADHIVANSRWTAKNILENGGSPDRLSVIYLGGDLVLGSDCLAQPASPSGFGLLTVGRLVAEKGHATVIKALSNLLDAGHEIEYTIVGDGPERDGLQKLAAELGIAQHIHFTGFVPHAQLEPYYRGSDLFVMPSEVEGFGVVFIEALSLGVPIIGSSGTGGPEDLAALGDCVSLVEPHNVAQLSKAIEALLTDPLRRRQMAQTGREIVNSHFTWERNAATTLALYEQLTSLDR